MVSTDVGKIDPGKLEKEENEDSKEEVKYLKTHTHILITVHQINDQPSVESIVTEVDSENEKPNLNQQVEDPNATDLELEEYDNGIDDIVGIDDNCDTNVNVDYIDNIIDNYEAEKENNQEIEDIKEESESSLESYKCSDDEGNQNNIPNEIKQEPYESVGTLKKEVIIDNDHKSHQLKDDSDDSSDLSSSDEDTTVEYMPDGEVMRKKSRGFKQLSNCKRFWKASLMTE